MHKETATGSQHINFQKNFFIKKVGHNSVQNFKKLKKIEFFFFLSLKQEVGWRRVNQNKIFLQNYLRSTQMLFKTSLQKKFEAFADDNLNVAQMMEFFFYDIKGENADYWYFPFPGMF